MKHCWFQPVSRQDEPRSAALKGLAKSVHSEAGVRKRGRIQKFNRASWKVHFSQSSTGTTGVAKAGVSKLASLSSNVHGQAPLGASEMIALAVLCIAGRDSGLL